MTSDDMSVMMLRPTGAMPPNLLAIFHAAEDAIHRKQVSAVPGPARIVLVLPGMKRASATHRHLAGRKSPKGEIVADSDGDTQLVSFECYDLTAWMVANGFLTAEINGVPYPPKEPA
jgi:hypothetical protein